MNKATQIGKNTIDMRNIIKKVIIGLLAGIISGLFSTGGGMILVPAFIHMLELEDTKARGTSVFCILPMVITSSFFYYKGNYIDWRIAIYCAIGGTIGGYIGAKLLKKLSEKVLKVTFVVFIIYVGVKMII